MTSFHHSHCTAESPINGSLFRRAGVATTGIVLSLALAGAIVPSSAAADRVVDSASPARVSSQSASVSTGARSALLEGTVFRAAVDEAVAIATAGWHGPGRSTLLDSAAFDRAVSEAVAMAAAPKHRSLVHAALERMPIPTIATITGIRV
jgi:hypothetical protein